jgi:hypothetical protein
MNSLHGGYVRGGVPGSGISFSESLTHHKNSEPKPAHALTYLACALFVVFWTAVVWVTTFKP